MNIQTLVHGFAKNIRELKAADYKESRLRLQYLDPFWTLLGWDVSNSEQRPPQDVEVLVEPSMDAVEDDGLRSREPDYLFRVGGFPRFIVEAKKPAVDIDTDKKAIFQAKRYAWNAAIPFAILTDFEQFRLYDTTLKPILNEPRRGVVEDFAIDFPDYPAKWEEMAAAFGRDAVAGGSLERLRARLRKVSSRHRLRTVDRMLFELRGEEPVDRVFLDYLEKHCQHFARTIYHDNKKDFPDADTLHGAARLTEAVQRLIDRLVFLRVCEDRGIAAWGALRETLDRIGGEGGDFYQSLCADFRDRDRQYNGYLFKYHFSETLAVSGDILADFVRTLYPPDGPWDFSAIGDDIFAIVYERFLGHVVTVKAGNAVVEEKPEVRHAGGVYYTPRFVVDAIVRRTVGPQIAAKTPAQVLDVKILDPACGSGSFLVAAFQYLLDHCRAAIAADPALASVPATPKARKKRKDIAFKDPKGRWHLAPDFKAALLTNCLHGVDIDQQAVEVTIMSLYLKMLEGPFPPNWQRDWVENQLLPPLENNICCGNSLINDADFDRYLSATHGDLFPLDSDVRFRINGFDWDSRMRGFGRLLDSQAAQERGWVGFDCIIGNPPYIRVQELNQWAPDECRFYKWRYHSAKKGNYDIYVAFAERCLELLAPDGLLGFIMPHKFWQAKYGEGLRKIIAEGRHLRDVIDFTHQLVFRNAAIYTAIHVLGKTKNPKRQIAVTRVEKLADGPAQMAEADTRRQSPGLHLFLAAHPTGDEPWSFVPPGRANLLSAVRAATTVTLGDLADRMAQGIRTSMNPVYVLERIAQKDNRYFSEHLGREIDLEPDLLCPFLSAEQIRRYEIVPSTKVVLIPYENRNAQNGTLISAKKLENQYPKTWSYLKACEASLKARENGRMDTSGWYGFIYPKNLILIDAPKILVPDIVESPSFVLDPKGGAAFVSGYAITLPSKSTHPLTLLLGLLNSSLLGAFLKDVSTPLRGGWYRPFPQFMSQIPIKLPEAIADKKLAERIVESVRGIMEAKVKLRDDKLSDRERTSLQGDVESLERRIDEAVFRLYGVKELPAGSPK
ncbi:MAG TPA: N-6 DNA methylase [Gemmataceae bacterium]|nr:N-6 DNA methylase [Gemmataceae bacterium]